MSELAQPRNHHSEPRQTSTFRSCSFKTCSPFFMHSRPAIRSRSCVHRSNTWPRRNGRRLTRMDLPSASTRTCFAIEQRCAVRLSLSEHNFDEAQLVLCTQTVHPTLVYSNAIAELAELPRLSKIEAADILLVVQRYSSPAQLPRDDIAASGAATPVRTLSPPATEAYAAIRAIASPPGSEFLHSPSSASSSSRPRASSETTTKLERDLALLRAELAYELMLKQQHTDRLGALHRERINKASADAERQALNDSLKIHKAAASEAREDLATERRDNAKIKAGSKSRLARLTGKLEVLGRKEVEWAEKEKADEVKMASMQVCLLWCFWSKSVLTRCAGYDYGTGGRARGYRQAAVRPRIAGEGGCAKAGRARADGRQDQAAHAILAGVVRLFALSSSMWPMKSEQG